MMKTNYLLLLSFVSVSLLLLFHCKTNSFPQSNQAIKNQTKQIIQELWEQKQDSTWITSSVVDYKYYSSGKIKEKIRRLITKENSKIVFKDTFSFNKHGHKTNSIRMTLQQGKWLPTFASFFINDKNGIIKERKDTIFTRDKRRPPITSFKYVYNDQNLLVEEIGQVFKGHQWVNSQKIKYVYDNQNKVIERHFPKWENNQWVPARKMVLTYNKNNHHISSLRLNWKDEQWVNNIKYLLVVNEQGQRTQELWQRWRNEKWVEFTRVTYHFKK